MHDLAMKLLKKKQGATFVEYAPKMKSIALLPKMDAGTRHKCVLSLIFRTFLQRKTSVCEVRVIVQVGKRHGVMLGDMYINDHGCAMFVNFIAYELRQWLVTAINKAHFFSLQVNASTDAANIEVELFMAIYLDPYTDDGRMHVRNCFFSSRYPCSVTGEGLYQCFCDAVKFVGVDNWKTNLSVLVVMVLLPICLLVVVYIDY